MKSLTSIFELMFFCLFSLLSLSACREDPASTGKPIIIRTTIGAEIFVKEAQVDGEKIKYTTTAGEKGAIETKFISNRSEVIKLTEYKSKISEEIERDNQNRWMDRGKESVKAKLKDPDSAQFRNIFFNRSKDGIPTTCGEVNSKNGFGGYIGFQKFISVGRPEGTFLQEEVSDFENTWYHFCK